jgi:hypothetical protein
LLRDIASGLIDLENLTDETLVAINRGDAFLGLMMEATSY